MARSRIELLLNRTVENLGIVGDVVKVKAGYARNYLLPHRVAEHPTPEKIEALKDARAKAQAELAKLRTERESLISKLDGVTIKLIRSCNDQGLLYGAVSQRDIADQLVTEGFGVDTRAVRLSSPIRRIGTYHCVIQFDRDLRSEIHIDVLPDRAIEAFTQQAAAAAETATESEPSDTNQSGEDETADAVTDAAGSKGKSKDKSKDKSKPAKGDAQGGRSSAGDDDSTGDKTKSARVRGKGESPARSGR